MILIYLEVAQNRYKEEKKVADWTYQIIDQSGKERKGNIVAESEAEAKISLRWMATWS